MHTKSLILSITIGLGLLLGVVAGIGIWASQQLQPVDVAQIETELFIIPKGATVTSTAALLAKKELIHNGLVFRLYARQVGLDRQLQAGSYELSPAMSVQKIIETLSQGSQSIWVTIPEGLRTEEVAQRFAASALPDFDPEEFITMAKPSEGRLFPDTYLVPRESDATELFALLTRTFQDKVELKMADQLQRNTQSLNEIVTLASLVQRESSSPNDMRMVAGVISNRLEQGMKLDIDASLSYLRGFDNDTQSWWSAPSPSLKTVDSPFNTYLYAGLPPSPIANPGVQAIEAALDPAPTSALFYLHAPSGQAYFAQTYEEHQANIERYLR